MQTISNQQTGSLIGEENCNGRLRVATIFEGRHLTLTEGWTSKSVIMSISPLLLIQSRIFGVCHQFLCEEYFQCDVEVHFKYPYGLQLMESL